MKDQDNEIGDAEVVDVHDDPAADIADETQSEPIQSLMAQPAPVDVAARARSAVEEFIEFASETRDQDGAAGPVTSLGDDAAALAPRRASVGRTDRVLQLLLLGNLVLVGMVLGLPSASHSTSPATAEHQSEVPEQPKHGAEPSLLSPRRQIGSVPAGELWQASVQEAGAGNYAEAVRLLKEYLDQGDGIQDVDRQMIYNQLAYYLVKDGRLDESREYSLKSQQLLVRTYLPEDLIKSAERAEQTNAAPQMRSAYARFLLQLKQASPALRKREAEAYLKLGDSYRLEASNGATNQGDEEHR